MKWIVLAIVVFIGAYTFVTLYYRKPGKAHEPYHDGKERAIAHRLQEAGYVRVAATFELPAEPSKARQQLAETKAQVRAAVGGVTPELKEILIDPPLLPNSYKDVVAPSQAKALLPYTFLYTCQLPDETSALGETRVYVKENRVAIITHFEKLAGALLSRTKESAVALTLPAGTLQAGQTYEITLVGAHDSKAWTVQGH